MKILVTGAAGFIGSEFVLQLVKRKAGAGQLIKIVVLDALTYAGHLENLETVRDQIEFVEGDIADAQMVDRLFQTHQFDCVFNFAAESHVDRSISDSSSFVRTNVIGVHSLLSAALKSWELRSTADKAKFRFIQVSTDEVFGALGDTGQFNEQTPYAPNSPYSASKAAGDHLVRAWFHTYGLPTLITNCSNNYGPRQFPEKLIPHMIRCALAEKPLPVYGAGHNIRDWIHVADHCTGVWLAYEKGQPGESYCFGGRSERQNLKVVEAICDQLNKLEPRADGKSYRDLISFVEDRKGHDWRYAIDDSKAERELGFKRQFANFEAGLTQTLKWYLENQTWIAAVTTVKSGTPAGEKR
jgi:dTDP-glucose 4,6-dehydratase